MVLFQQQELIKGDETVRRNSGILKEMRLIILFYIFFSAGVFVPTVSDPSGFVLYLHVCKSKTTQFLSFLRMQLKDIPATKLPTGTEVAFRRKYLSTP